MLIYFEKTKFCKITVTTELLVCARYSLQFDIILKICARKTLTVTYKGGGNPQTFWIWAMVKKLNGK